MKKLLLTFLFQFSILIALSQLLPQLRSVDCNRINTQPYQTLYANLTSGTQYKFKVTNLNTGITDSLISIDRGFKLNEIPTVNGYNCTFDVSVRMDDGSGFGPYGNVCHPSSIGLKTQLRSYDCGRHLISVNYPVYASVSSADSWDFQVRNVTSPSIVDDVFGLPTRKFQLTMASSQFQLYDQEYEIRVRTTQNGVIQSWGNWCSVFTPPIAPPLITVGCNQTFNMLAYEYITCTDLSSSGATLYRWRLRIGNTVIDTAHTIDNQVRMVDFLDASNQPMYDYNQTYNLSIAAFIGGAWTSYGTSCIVKTSPEALTQVQYIGNNIGCGQTLASFSTPIIVYAIFSATQYEYKVTDLTPGSYNQGVQTLIKSTKSFSLNELTNYAFGHDYSVRCRVTFKGIQYSFGSSCSVTSPLPIVKLRPPDCNRILTNPHQKLYANNSLNFDNPQGLDPINSYKFTCNGMESPWKSTRDIKIAEIIGMTPTPGLYGIQVKVTYEGVEQSYSSQCVVTVPSIIPINKPDIKIIKNLPKRKIVKYINSMGQEINPLETKGMIIIIYSDGSIEKTIK